jgi:hypothetical protein
MAGRDRDGNIAVGCDEGMWLIDRDDARSYHTARVYMALAAVLTGLAVWWALA